MKALLKGRHRVDDLLQIILSEDAGTHETRKEATAPYIIRESAEP
jgi:hypothetical protein